MTKMCLYSLNPYLLRFAGSHNNLGVLTLKNHSNWVLNGRTLESNCDYKELSLNLFSHIVKDLEENYPIFARHFLDLPNLEGAIRQLALEVIKLVKVFRDHSFACILIDTSSSHHIDTLVCELAARFTNIPQVFLFPIDYIALGRLETLPMIQYKNNSDRKILPLMLSRPNSLQLRNFQRIERAPILTYSPSHPPIEKIAMVLPIFSRALISTFIRRILRKKPEYSPFGSQWLRPYNLLAILCFLKKQKNNNLHLQQLIARDRKKTTKIIEELRIDSTKFALLIYGQWQPESSSFPDGKPFFNFLDIVIYIRNQGFTGPLIFKEHPAMNFFFLNKRFSRVGISRSYEFYDAMKELGVIFIDDDKDFRSMENAIPVTSTGSISFERARQNLPSIVLGNPWYRESNAYLNSNEFEDFCKVGFLPKKNYQDLYQLFIEQQVSQALMPGTPNENDSAEIKSDFESNFSYLLEKLEILVD